MTLGLTEAQRERGQRVAEREGRESKKPTIETIFGDFRIEIFRVCLRCEKCQSWLIFFSYFLLYYINNKKQAHLFALRTPFLATEEHEVAEAGADPGAERALDLLLGNNSYAFIDIFQFLNVAARVRHNKF